MTDPIVTVVIPAYNRQAELRRALASLKTQTLTEFECLVVDDGSMVPLESIVAEFNDSRFVCVRNAANGGPYNARTVGYKLMRGEFLFQLDSDWEAYPWALAQAARYLRATPEVDAVSGMHVRQSDSTMFVRVREGKKIIGPTEYRTLKNPPDCVGAVRRDVVVEWLRKRTDYFAMEFHQWFTFGLQHAQLYVDEPWTRYHVSSSDRVSVGSRERRLDDYVRFIDEHDELLRSTDTESLPDVLFNMWFDLLRYGRRSDSRRIAGYLRSRNVSISRKVMAKIGRKLLSAANIGRGNDRRIHFI